jgi:hypothetical protein
MKAILNLVILIVLFVVTVRFVAPVAGHCYTDMRRSTVCFGFMVYPNGPYFGLTEFRLGK